MSEGIDKIYDKVHEVISSTIDEFLKKESGILGVTEGKFTTIEEYRKVTGKRFRMSKDQIKRGLSREEAFKEFLRK